MNNLNYPGNQMIYYFYFYFFGEWIVSVFSNTVLIWGTAYMLEKFDILSGHVVLRVSLKDNII